MSVLGGDAVVGGDKGTVAGTFGTIILSSHQAKFGLLGSKCCYAVLKYLKFINSLTSPHPIIISKQNIANNTIHIVVFLRFSMFKS